MAGLLWGEIAPGVAGVGVVGVGVVGGTDGAAGGCWTMTVGGAWFWSAGGGAETGVTGVPTGCTMGDA